MTEDTAAHAYVARVTDVQPHPDSDKLDIISIAGKINIANRTSHEQPRYRIGDYAIVLEENLILPNWLLQYMDLWDAIKNKGVLAGSKGNRTKGRNIAGLRSAVALCAVDWERIEDTPIESTPDYVLQHGRLTIPPAHGVLLSKVVNRYEMSAVAISPIGQDVAAIMGITRYEPSQF